MMAIVIAVFVILWVILFLLLAMVNSRVQNLRLNGYKPVQRDYYIASTDTYYKWNDKSLENAIDSKLRVQRHLVWGGLAKVGVVWVAEANKTTVGHWEKQKRGKS